MAVLLGLQPAGEAHLMFDEVVTPGQRQLALRAQRACTVPVLAAKLVPSCCARLRAVPQGQLGAPSCAGGRCCHESGC